MRGMMSWAVSIAAMLLSAQAAVASENFPSIVVTVAPLKPYVDEIIHGQGEAQNLLRPGQEPHDFSLTIPQGQLLDKADIVIVPDLSISPFLKRLLAKNTHVKVIELSKLEGANPLPYDSTNPWVDAMKAAPAPNSSQQHWWRKQDSKNLSDTNKEAPAPHIWPTDGTKPKPADRAAPADKKDTSTPEAKKDEPPMTDPHIWLDPERMAAIAVPLATAISEHYPSARPELLANARTLSTHIRRELMPNLREMLSKPSSAVTAVGKPQLPFITYHAAYQYFLQRFQLKHEGEITNRPEEIIGAATAAKMLNGAQGLHVNCIIGEQHNAMMTRIAKLTNARVILLSPEQLVMRKNVDAHEWIRNDYDRLMYVTAKAFSGCL